MKCPKCAGSLMKMTVQKRAEYGADILQDAEKTQRIELDQCLVCNGVWFDLHELDHYLAEKLFIVDSPKSVDYKKHESQEGICPRCEVKMVRKPAPLEEDFMVDVCGKCHGVWLDSHELDRLEDKNISFSERMRLVFRNFKHSFSKES